MSVGMSVLIVGALAYTRWRKKKTTLQTCQRLYDFDTNELMIEINRREKLDKAFRSLCLSSVVPVDSHRPSRAAGPDPALAPPLARATLHNKVILRTQRPTAFQKWLPHRPKDASKPQRRGRTRLRSESVRLGSAATYVWVSVVLLVVVGCYVVRQRVIEAEFAPNVELGSAINIFAKLYSSFVTLHCSVVQLVVWGDSARVGGMPVLAFIAQQNRIFKQEVVGPLGDIKADTRQTPLTVAMQGVWTKTFCELFVLSTDDTLPIQNCSNAMAGLATQPMYKFLSGYPLLIDELVIRWQSSQTLEAKRQIFTEDRYASMLAYSFFNVFGTADWIYYLSLAPLVSILRNNLPQIMTLLNLINIISIPIVIVCLSIACCLILLDMNKVENLRMAIYVAYPRRLIRANQSLANKLKAASNYH